jgi:hypothetical protein
MREGEMMLRVESDVQQHERGQGRGRDQGGESLK